jgi:ceramide glucosyltransferase
VSPLAAAHQLLGLMGMVLLGVAGGYTAVALLASLVWHLRSLRRPREGWRPAVTILKPLCGAEPELLENLRSYCRQDYPEFQMVLGVRDGADRALESVARLRQEFPQLQIEVVIAETQHGSNRKVSNLLNMLPHARHDVLIITDSDTRVRAGYLDSVAAPLSERRIGLVTCLYRCVPAGGLWSRLGAMYINDWYMPSVMLAWLFGHREYVSGQTIALRRETLDAMGGLRAIANHLADDYQLGKAVRGLGQRTVLSHCVVTTVEQQPGGADLMGHELRWMRTLRSLAPAGFRFVFVSFTLPLVLIGYVLASLSAHVGGPTVLAAATLAGRVMLSWLPRLAERRIPLSDLLLLPVRDLLLCWTWSRAFFGSRVRWRGCEFEVDRHGVMRSSL